MNRLPRRTLLMALLAAFVWTLTMRPLGSALHRSAPSVTPTVAAPAGAAGVHPGILRLHILANSNRPADQAAKLAVRSAILPILEARIGGAASVEAAEGAARRAAPALEARAITTLGALGRPYGARVVVGDAYFPAKRDGSLRLGPGIYAAVTVILGRGEGQNWWCVLFPDMCLANPLDSVSQSEPASGPERLIGAGRADGHERDRIDTFWAALWSWL